MYMSKPEITYAMLHKCVLYYYLSPLIFLNIYRLSNKDNCCAVRVYCLRRIIGDVLRQ